jgi:hypothetical protein
MADIISRQPFFFTKMVTVQQTCWQTSAARVKIFSNQTFLLLCNSDLE